MRIAVTGGSGFIGSHVVDKLLDAGHTVVVIDMRPPHRPDALFVRGDVLDPEALRKGLRDCDVVFHLAGVANVNDAAADPVRTAELNVTGTANVWQIARECNVTRAVLASTVWVYGAASGTANEVDETAAFDLGRTDHIYTSSKVAAELVVHSFHHLYGQEFTILRYGIPYGPRMRDELVIARFVDNALTHKPIVVHGDGSQYRNYVYVEDLADAHVLALGSEGANGTFNLEGREQVTVRELVDAVVAVVPEHVDYEFGAARPGDYEGRAVSAAHAETTLGWRPKVEFNDGLRRYVDWYQRRDEHPIPMAPLARRRRTLLDPALWTVPLVLAVLALPALAVHGHTPLSFAWRSLAVVLAAGATWLTARLAPRAAPRLAAVVLCFTGLWLLTQASEPLVPIVATFLGVGVGLLVKDRSASTAVPVLGLTAIATALITLGATVSVLLAWWVGAALIADSCRGLVADAIREPRRRVGFLLDAAAVLVAAALTAVVGGTSVNASWFSQPVRHGSRARGEVALTVDIVDPGSATVVADALAHEHVKGTFFMSGKAVRANPSGARAILDRAQLLGNGTYDGTRWGVFDPRVGQHVMAESTFREATQVCPAFLRPPAGYHTPLLAWSARHRGIAVVGSDVVVTTREADEPAEMTERVLGAVRAGSIVTIDITHGGVAAAQIAAASMPAIVEGLRSRNLTPVPLDALLGRPSYVSHC